MPLKSDLELAAVTLPLDIVLELIRLSKSGLSEETAALLKIEIASVLLSMPRVEDEVVAALIRETFE